MERRINKGLENLKPFLREGEELLFNYYKIPKDDDPTVEQFMKQYEKLYQNMRIIENAAFHSDGYLMEDSVAVVGIPKPVSE